MLEWIGYGGTFKDFMHAGLNQPGTLVRVEGQAYLLGHVNCLGGACDDCCDVRWLDMVEAYTVVWKEEV